MTNAEKFEEVFGIKIDSCPDDPCCIADDKYCSVNGFSGLIKDKKCQDCELFQFWSKEYNKTEDNEDISKVFLLGALFGVVATSDEVLSMIEKELKNKEVKENE